MRQNPLFPPHCEWIPPDSFPDLSGAKEIAIDLETRDENLESYGPGWPRNDGYVVGYAIAVEGWCGYFPVAHEGGGNLDKGAVERWVGRVLELECPKVMHNAAYDLGWLLACGFKVNGTIIDTMIAAACLDENRMSYSLNSLGFDYLKQTKSEQGLRDAARDFGVHPKKELWRLPAMYVGEYAEADAELTLQLWQCFKPLLRREDVESVFDLETRVLPVLVNMTRQGVRFDRERALSLIEEMTSREKELLADIRSTAAMPVDVWAAASIAKAFDKLGLAYPRTETGLPSFTKTFLDGLDHPLSKAIVEARELNKTYGTFLRPYLDLSEHDGRIHSHVNQLRSDEGGTVTGRLCVHGETVLELNTGPVKIGDYEPTGREFIKTHTGEWHRVLRRYNKGMENMVELVASNGSRVSCTRGHRVLTCRGWVPVGNLQVGDTLYHVSKQSEIEGRENLPTGHRGLFIGRTSDDAGDWEETGAGGTHNTGHSAEKTASQAAGKGTGAASVALQNGGPQSHERQAGGASSQLQGGMLRWEGLHSCPEAKVVYGEKGEQARLPTPPCAVRSTGIDRDPARVGSTSHRRDHYEQPHRQLGSSHSFGASGFAQEVTVAEINAVGEARVWDIEVEGDHSYIAQGLIHHNSMNSPNLQQVPARHEVIGPLVRSLFLPEEGELWASCDFSSQEPRLLVHYATLLGLPGSEVMQAAYLKDPRTDFHQMVADMAGIKRKQAKTIGLGLCIAEGQLVLTNSGLIPIEQIKECHKLWDGVEWVAHEGVVFMGIKEVITYGNLTATPDHNVWAVKSGKVPFRVAASRLDALVSTGNAGQPVRYVDRCEQGNTAPREASIRKGAMRLWNRRLETVRQPQEWEVLPVLRLCGAQTPSAGGAFTGELRRDAVLTAKGHGSHATMPKPKGPWVEELRGAWNSVRIFFSKGLRGISTLLAPSVRMDGHDDRPDQQQRELCNREHPEILVSREQHEPKKYAKVYDIINAGPRHRFTVSNVLVSNCYGMGKHKLADSLDMSVDEASALITLFHQKVPFLRSTIDAVMRRIENPASGGAIRTLLGRKCRFPLFEPVQWGVNKALPYEQAIIEYGPRVKRAMTYKGLNRLIQGSAADQTKMAMVKLNEAGFNIKLQLHDEIVVSVKTREEAEEVGRIMATAVELAIPSVVDVEVGENWGSAK